MDRQEIRSVMAQSQAGELTFPKVVGRLLEAGVESYLVDFATGKETLYMQDGTAFEEAMKLPVRSVNEVYSATGIREAIQAAQADRVRYPEFVRLAAAAGIVGYWAFLTGRKVVYFGRKGEMHTEPFPGADA